MTTALVLGGGGVTGIAWETGLLFGLERAGVRVRDADRLVGTSAGSTVVAQLASGTDLSELYRRQAGGLVAEKAAAFSGADLWRLVSTLLFTRDRAKALRGLGAESQARVRPGEAAERRAIIAERVPVDVWPDRDVRIPAVHVETGLLRVFTREDGVALIDAVGASCAVPLVWPPVEIDGQHYIDGGLPYPANVQLASGCDTVLVIAPITRGLGLGTSVKAQVRALGGDVRSVVLSPDREAKRSMGRNSLDPAARKASAIAGLAQAERVVESVRGLF